MLETRARNIEYNMVLTIVTQSILWNENSKESLMNMKI